MTILSFVFLARSVVASQPGESSSGALVHVAAGVVQLFIDDFLIEQQTGLERTLHRPRKDDGGNVPVIALPEEGTLLAKGTILRDPRLGRYVLFAKGFRTKQIHRFTSADGLNWSGAREAKGRPVEIDQRHPVTGAHMDRQYGGMHCFFYDTRDTTYPYKGWMFMGNWGDEHEGVYFIRSTDGLKWERGLMVVEGYAGQGDTSCRVIRQEGYVVYGPGDTTRFGYDPVSNRFLGIFKFFTTEPVRSENHLRCRAYAFLDRLDKPFNIEQIRRVELLPPATAKNGDMPGDEYYASTAWRYGSLWLGGLVVWHGTGDYPYSAAGCAFLKLVVSRDGLHWRKVPYPNDAGAPEVFIPNGAEGGNNGQNDGGYMSEFSQGPFRLGDELVYYYGCSSYGKNHPPDVRISGGGVFRARLRLDGFVSVDGGTLTTRPLKLEGRRLSVNAVGPVEVEVLDTAGEPLGRSAIRGDSVRHRVTFDDETLGQVAGQCAVRLRWRVSEDGQLYSFTVN